VANLGLDLDMAHVSSALRLNKSSRDQETLKQEVTRSGVSLENQTILNLLKRPEIGSVRKTERTPDLLISCGSIPPGLLWRR
jgi:hypothetical protein